MSRVGTVDCPLCKKNPADVIDTSKGLLIEACRRCNEQYSYNNYSHTYNKYDPYSKDTYKNLDYERAMYNEKLYKPEPIAVDPNHLAQLKEQTALTAALNAENKIAEERNKAEAERRKLLNLLKETGLDQSLDG